MWVQEVERRLTRALQVIGYILAVLVLVAAVVAGHEVV